MERKKAYLIEKFGKEVSNEDVAPICKNCVYFSFGRCGITPSSSECDSEMLCSYPEDFDVYNESVVHGNEYKEIKKSKWRLNARCKY